MKILTYYLLFGKGFGVYEKYNEINGFLNAVFVLN